MAREEIYDKVVATTCQMLAVSGDRVSGKARFVEDLGADSLDLVEIVMALEETFDAQIDDSKLESIRTINDVVDTIEALTNKTTEM